MTATKGKDAQTIQMCGHKLEINGDAMEDQHLRLTASGGQLTRREGRGQRPTSRDFEIILEVPVMLGEVATKEGQRLLNHKLIQTLTSLSQPPARMSVSKLVDIQTPIDELPNSSILQLRLMSFQNRRY